MTFVPTLSDFFKETTEKGYKIFKDETKLYNLNIIGWRNKASRPNYFDDYIAIYYKWSNNWYYKYWKATTLPGIPWLKNPLNDKGTAILVPGQYFHAYSLGAYKGYPALKQVLPVKVYRDNNRDSQFNKDSVTIEEGIFGIHIHKASLWTKYVNRFSAGCQVFQYKKDFDTFITYLRQSALLWGNSFTYTLLEYDV